MRILICAQQAPLPPVNGFRLQVAAPLDAAYVNTEARLLRASGARAMVLRGQLARVRRFEAAEYAHFRSVVVVSEADRLALMALDPRLEPVVIPNGVDTAAFAP